MYGKTQMLMALVLAVSLAFAGMAMADGEFSPGDSATELDDVQLAEGETTDYTFQTDDTNAKAVRVKDSDGNLIHENTGISTTTDDDSNDIVETSFDDTDLINDADYPVEDGDTLTIEVYDETDTEVDQTLEQDVDGVFDASTSLDAESDNYEDRVSFEDVGKYQIPFTNFSFGAESEHVDHEQEVVASSSDMDQDEVSVVLNLDTDTANAYDNAVPDDASGGDALSTTVVVNGTEVPIYLNSAGDSASDHDYEVVYDQDEDRVEVTHGTDFQSVQIDNDTSDPITLSHAWTFDDISYTFALTN